MIMHVQKHKQVLYSLQKHTILVYSSVQRLCSQFQADFYLLLSIKCIVVQVIHSTSAEGKIDMLAELTGPYI